MGIKGLKSFVDNNNRQLKRRHRLRDTCLVIDGQNLAVRLLWSSGTEVQHYLYGGDYKRFSVTVRDFFETLDKSGVRALVVVDGGLDQSDNKSEELKRRFSEKLKTTKKLSDGKIRSYDNKVVSTLFKPVFIDVLTELSVTHIQTSYGADAVIARIANELKCPALSDDSDFFIFDIMFGVISCDDLVRALNLNAKEVDLYLVDNLIQQFPGLERQVLPLFATLVGNDYVPSHVFDEIMKDIADRTKEEERKSMSLKVDNQKHNKFIEVLEKLKNWRANELMDTIGQHLSEENLNLFKNSLDNYRTENVDIIVHNHKTKTESKTKTNTKTKTKHDFTVRLTNKDQSLPVWFTEEFKQCRLNPSLLNYIKMKYDFLDPNIEDHSWPSSYAPTQQLSQYLFALVRTDDQNKEPLLLYDRIDSEMTTYSLEPLLRTPKGRLLPDLHRIRDLSERDRRLLLTDILVINERLVDQLKAQFGGTESESSGGVFLVLALRYYLTKCTHEVWTEFVCALLTCITISGRIGSDKTNKLIPSLSRYNGRPLHSTSKPFEPRIVHFFNEYQICLRVISQLNSLLGSSLPMGRPFSGLNGVFIYNLTVELATHPNDPWKRMSALFEWHSYNGAYKLFTNLWDIAMKGLVDKLVRCPPITSRPPPHDNLGDRGSGRDRGSTRGKRRTEDQKLIIFGQCKIKTE